jgi:hypothetical protein
MTCGSGSGSRTLVVPQTDGKRTLDCDESPGSVADAAPPEVPSSASYKWTFIDDAYFAILPLPKTDKTRKAVRPHAVPACLRRMSGS